MSKASRVGRLLRLAEVLETVPDVSSEVYTDDWGLKNRRYGQLDGGGFVDGGEPVYFNMASMRVGQPCGAICCAVGIGAIIEDADGRDGWGFDYFLFMFKTYGFTMFSPDYAWLFAGDWADAKDASARTARAAAHRIYAYVVMGCKSKWEWGSWVDWPAFVAEYPFESTKAAALALALVGGMV